MESKHTDEKKIIADNPGKGPCAFFATANGLIPYLRDEIISGKADAEDSLFNKLIPPKLVIGPENETSKNKLKREKSLAIYKANLKQEIMSFQYKKSYTWIVEWFRAGLRTVSGAAIGVNPLLHKLEKLFRNDLVDTRTTRISIMLEDLKNDREQLKEDPIMKEMIRAFNAFQRGQPPISKIDDYPNESDKYATLRKQVKKCAERFNQINKGKYPNPKNDKKGEKISDAAFDLLLAYTCDPKKKNMVDVALRSTDPYVPQKRFELDSSSALSSYINHKKSSLTYGENKDLEELGKKLEVSISVMTDTPGVVSMESEMTKGFSKKITLNFIEGGKLTGNHYNTIHSESEFNVGTERGQLFTKFGKHTNFSTYPDFNGEEILRILSSAAGVGHAVTTFFSLRTNVMEKEIPGRLKVLAKENKIAEMLSVIDFYQQSKQGLGSEFNAALKYIQLRAEDQRIHLEKQLSPEGTYQNEFERLSFELRVLNSTISEKVSKGKPTVKDRLELKQLNMELEKLYDKVYALRVASEIYKSQPKLMQASQEFLKNIFNTLSESSRNARRSDFDKLEKAMDATLHVALK